MRTIIVAIFLLFFFILSIPLYLVEIIIGKFSPKRKVQTAQAIIVWAFKVILFISGTNMTVLGLENIPSDQPVLFVSNHRSYFDIVTAYATTPHLTGFIAKKEMKNLPFINIWMKYLNCLFLDRENIREGLKTILKGIENIKNGYSMFIAPEGTRNQGDEMLPFKEGSFKLAEKSGCPVIPVAISNTDAIFERQIPWIKKANVVIEYGKPIDLKQLDPDTKKRAGSYIQGIIRDTLEKNKSLI